jgi:hypothetical protein
MPSGPMNKEQLFYCNQNNNNLNKLCCFVEKFIFYFGEKVVDKYLF